MVRIAGTELTQLPIFALLRTQLERGFKKVMQNHYSEFASNSGHGPTTVERWLDFLKTANAFLNETP